MIYTITLNPSIDYLVHVNDFTEGKVNRMTSDKKFPGGKGINVTRILKELGFSSTVYGFIGGYTGQILIDSLQREGILNNFTSIKEDTRINIKLKTTTETEINSLGPTIEEEAQEDIKNKLKALTNKDIVILAGSTPPSLPKNFYNQLIEIIQQTGAQFVMDTTGQDLLDAINNKALLVKPNKEEFEQICGKRFSTIEEMIPYGQKMVANGVKNVLISLASEGALLFCKEGVYFANVPKGKTKNSVGAGDSMVAGFTGVYNDTKDVLKAFKYGIACGSATAFSEDLASIETINKQLEHVTIEKWS